MPSNRIDSSSPDDRDFDVVIAGAGPGGCAAALTFKAHAPQLRICQIDRADNTGSLIGEAASPHLRPMLEQLGLWRDFPSLGHTPVYRSRAAWGAAAMDGVEFLELPLRQGWTLDRGGFNRFLAEAASRAVACRLNATIRNVARDARGRWQIDTGPHDPAVTARAVIDATGRAAAICRMLGARPERSDRLIACYALTDDAPGAEAGVLLETCPVGWWYTARIPGARRVLAFMTDADIARDTGALTDAGFVRLLAETRHICHAVAPDAMVRAVPHPSASQVMKAALPEGLLPVGDAAACFDPIAASGIVKALRSGIFATYAIADHLRGVRPDALRNYASFLGDEWAIYADTRRSFYARERRWPDNPFWSRRHVTDRPVREAAR